ncbi:MAG: aconitase family protein, partial [Candidatus Porifericomitaceae bacterium WSBS_2022_MAG_OTU9]
MLETLYDKLWRAHQVCDLEGDLSLIYIDRHLIHEVTSPQAFAGLKLRQRRLRQPEATLAVMDHAIPTKNRLHIADPVAKEQVATLERNCSASQVALYDMSDLRQGIVHVIGPEQGFCLPGMTVVCGDSHTSTNGALGTLAFGIGTSEVEHVFATQCLPLSRWRNMRINFKGTLPQGLYAKDMILSCIGAIGTAGATGCAIEYAGEAIQALSVEGRMTMCNMSIEAGARAGMVAVDDTTLDYIKGRPLAPTGVLWEQAVEYWRSLHSDPGSHFDKEVEMDVSKLEPQLTWGTSPEMVCGITGEVPDPAAEKDLVRRSGMSNALRYMGLEPGTAMTSI